MTGYDTNDIVQKLRCEAKDAIQSELALHNLYTDQDVVSQQIREVKSFEIWKANNNALLSKVDAAIAADEIVEKDLKKQQEELKAVGFKLTGEERALDGLLVSETDPAKRDQILARKTELTDKITAVAAKYIAVAVERTRRTKETPSDNVGKVPKTTIDIERENDELLRPLGLTQARYLKKKKSIVSIGENTKAADLDSASRRKLFEINNATMSMKLDFKVTENNNNNANGSIVWPIHLGTITLGYKAGMDKGRIAQRVVDTTSLFQELSRFKCDDAPTTPTSPRARPYPIVGNVGVDEYIEQYFRISDTTTIATGKDTFTDSLTFTTKIGGQLNPQIEIRPVSPSLVKAGIDLTSDRTDLHVVTLQIRPYSPPGGSSDTKVQITKVPEVSVNISEGLDIRSTAIDVR